MPFCIYSKGMARPTEEPSLSDIPSIIIYFHDMSTVYVLGSLSNIQLKQKTRYRVQISRSTHAIAECGEPVGNCGHTNCGNTYRIWPSLNRKSSLTKGKSQLNPIFENDRIHATEITAQSYDCGNSWFNLLTYKRRRICIERLMHEMDKLFEYAIFDICIRKSTNPCWMCRLACSIWEN